MLDGQRFTSAEVALEVKSLRRIISAFLNYSDAAEEDVKRYERSYKKLSPKHKALLYNLPLKFRNIRRCISVNSHFILSMLQAFEPPIDMSHGIQRFNEDNSRSTSGNAILSQPDANLKDGNNNFDLSASTSGRSFIFENDQFSHGDDGDGSWKPPERINSLASTTSNPQDSVTKTTVASDDNFSVNDGQGNPRPRDWLDSSLQLDVPFIDVDKVRCIIRNIVRDWAPEGLIERDQCYKPILEELDRLFPNRSKSSPPSCLVPGAGLGSTQSPMEWTIYPWIHSNCNNLSDMDQLRPVKFPDIHPESAGITEGFSMCAGDFVEVYGDAACEGSWDSVVTCFFIDTAHNIAEYIEIISKILKHGGVWINFGPLLYHFADSYGEDEMSIEVSLEEVKKIAYYYGLQMEVERTIETTYTSNPRSMMQNRYFAAFWTMRKLIS